MRVLHFVGFRDDRYWNAVWVFGLPHFIHRKWDRRAAREIGPDDLIVFATGDERQEPSAINGDDYREPLELRPRKSIKGHHRRRRRR